MLSFGFGWAFSVGGADQDAGTGVTTDGSGNVYVTGWLLSSTVNFDPNHTNPRNPNNTLTNPNPGTANVQFVAKYTANQTFQWVTPLGGGNEGSKIAVDGAGHVYVAYLDGTNTTHLAQLDAATGAPGWNASISGSTASTADGAPYDGVAVGPSGNVYVTGRNASTQAFVAKINASGSLLWNQSPNGSSSEGLTVAVDSSENVYLAYVNGSNVSVGKLNPANGNTVWAGSVGTDGNAGAGIALDSGGNVYVTGGGSYFTKNGFFVAKLAPSVNGSLTQSWNEKISGPALSTGVAVDPAGNIYTTGSFRGSVDFDPGKGRYILQSASNFYDVFASKLDTNGKFVAAADIVRGSGNNYGHAIALDNTSSGSPIVYTTGGFRGTADFDPTSGTYDLTVDGGSSSPLQDIYVSQLTQLSGGAAAVSPPLVGSDPMDPLSIMPMGQAPPSIKKGSLSGATSVAPQAMMVDLAADSLQHLAALPVVAEARLPIAFEPLPPRPWLDGFFTEFEGSFVQDFNLG